VSSRPPPLATIRLDRSLPRLPAVPLVMIAAGIAGVVAGVVQGGALGIGLVVLGAVVGILGLIGGLVLTSVGLEVEEAQIRVHWLGGERRYPLARGAVTRVTVSGPQASALQPRFGALGWALGPARLRGEETIDTVRLAPAPTMILVPTERGRLAIAPHSEAELLEALSEAAQVRQRLDELARTAPPVEAAPETKAESRPRETPSVAPSVEDGEPRHTLTGIERSILERRLAAERDAIEAGSVGPGVASTADADLRAAGGEAAIAVAPPRRRRARRVRWLTPQLPPGLGVSIAFIVLPLLAAGAIWGIGNALDRLPADGTDQLRVVILALALGGPGTAVGALMARIWWPRIMGVVVTGGIVALVVAARALLGG
jgi:hypothetical protein